MNTISILENKKFNNYLKYFFKDDKKNKFKVRYRYKEELFEFLFHLDCTKIRTVFNNEKIGNICYSLKVFYNNNQICALYNTDTDIEYYYDYSFESCHQSCSYHLLRIIIENTINHIKNNLDVYLIKYNYEKLQEKLPIKEIKDKLIKI